MSGGRASVQFKKGKTNQTQTGDVSAIDPLGAWFTTNFIIEAKFLRDLELASGIVNHTGMLWGFWRKLKHDADKAKKCPLLVGKSNRVQPIVLLAPAGVKLLHLSSQQALAILPTWKASMYSLKYILEQPYKGELSAGVPDEGDAA